MGLNNPLGVSLLLQCQVNAKNNDTYALASPPEARLLLATNASGLGAGLEAGFSSQVTLRMAEQPSSDLVQVQMVKVQEKHQGSLTISSTQMTNVISEDLGYERHNQLQSDATIYRAHLNSHPLKDTCPG